MINVSTVKGPDDPVPISFKSFHKVEKVQYNKPRM